MNLNDYRNPCKGKMKNSSKRRLEAFRLNKSKEFQARIHREAFEDTTRINIKASEIANIPEGMKDLVLAMLNIQTLETVAQSSPKLFADIVAEEEYDSGYCFDDEFKICDLMTDDTEPEQSWAEQIDEEETSTESVGLSNNSVPPGSITGLANVSVDPVDVLSEHVMRVTDFTLPSPHSDLSYYENNGNLCERKFYASFLDPGEAFSDQCPRNRSYCKLCENLLFAKLLSRKKFRSTVRDKFGHTVTSASGTRPVFTKRWKYMKYQMICNHYAKLGRDIRTLYDSVKSYPPRHRRNIYSKIGFLLDERRKLFQNCQECEEKIEVIRVPRTRSKRTRRKRKDPRSAARVQKNI